ncbi:unnamed protein product [Rotaria socialis]|uniref:Uncharacterized protein n=1 Tax=Rotaria socialis TaxID=392032 RepID=A0A817TIP3_9BILA|nr:unnamed protein product [Rotaria socialis]CAF4497087.1 unnamed protein product [Rotaria socialis]
MSFRSFKSKLKTRENSSTEITLTTLCETQADEHHASDIEKVQNEIEYKQNTLDLFMNHVLITLDANIDDLKLSIDKKRPEQKIYKLSICDVWLRLKTIEHMEPLSLVKYLRTSQLHRAEIKSSDVTDCTINIEPQIFTNRRRSRFIHFHMCTASDEFYLSVGAYVGLVIFSYQNQSKFILNGHHCQRGDILVKQTKLFSSTQTVHRGIYDALFKWYFGRVIDENFSGIGFICSNDKWRFDLITHNDREIFLYEYRVFDMFMLTHWLTRSIIAHNVHDMEVHVKDLLLKQYDVVKKKLISQENTELLNCWKELIGSDSKDLDLAIKQIILTIKNDIENYFQEIGIEINVPSELLKQNIS